MPDTKEKQETQPKIIVSPEIEALFGAGAHLGYFRSRRHPKMAQYVFCTRNNMEIVDLEKTQRALQEAELFLYGLGKSGISVLWVGTKPSARQHSETVGKRLGMPYVSKRWLGGTLTNFAIIDKRLSYWKQLEREAASGELERYVKKERLVKLTELRKLSQMFGGLRELNTPPGAVVIIDPDYEKTALREAQKKGIPVVALLNTDCNPTGIPYSIPGNDQAFLVIELIFGRLAEAYERGARERHAAETSLAPSAENKPDATQ